MAFDKYGIDDGDALDKPRLCDACLMNEHDTLQIVKHAVCACSVPTTVVSDYLDPDKLIEIELCEDHAEMFADWSQVYWEDCA